MISKEERLHKNIRIISFAEKKKSTDIIIDQGHQKPAGKAAYAQQLNEKLQTFQKTSFPFKDNHLFSCLSICLWKGKTPMSPSQDTSEKVQMKHKDKEGTNYVQKQCIKILHEAQALSSSRRLAVLFCFVREKGFSWKPGTNLHKNFVQVLYTNLRIKWPMCLLEIN